MDKRVPEIFLGVLLILVLVFLFMPVSSLSKDSKSSSESRTVSYVIQNECNGGDCGFVKYPGNYADDRTYTSRAENKVFDGALGEVGYYAVYLKNYACSGKYYSVRFHFKDCCSVEQTRLVTKYVSPGNEVLFSYKDVGNEFRYSSWRYEIVDSPSGSTYSVNKGYCC